MPTHTSKKEENIQICKDVVAEHYQNHSYYRDIFVCGDMAIDVWNILKTKSVNAKICIGNLDNDIEIPIESNHAWVLAEVSADDWLALETTGGFLVNIKDNPRYYRGWDFYTPKQFKQYLQLLTQYNDLSLKDNDIQTQCNQLQNKIQYNQANNIKNDDLYNLNNKLVECNIRLKDLNEVLSKMTALLMY